MEGDTFDEIFLKIQKLEEKNDELRKKIKEKEKFKKDNKKKISENKIEKNKKNDSITLDDDRKAAKRLENELNFLNNNYYQITENLVDKKIEFRPNKNYGSIYILGDFNGWKPELMQKNEQGYSYKIVLIKGFKYYYSLHSYEDSILDENSPYEENPSNLELQNYIDLHQNDNDKTTNFDYKEDLNILKASQRNFLLLNVKDDNDNTIFLDKFKRHVVHSKNKSSTDNCKNSLENINAYYDSEIKKIDAIENKNEFKKLKSYFNNRILIQNSPIMKDVQYQYRIISLSEDMNSFICIRLYDHNQIKLNKIYYSDINNCWKFPYSEIVSTKITKRDKLYHLLPKKDSEKILNDYNNDTENIIIAYFNDLEEFNKNSRFKRYRKINNVDDLVKPKKIEPEDVDMNDYEYHFLNNEITKIKNKDDLSYVEFKIIEENKKEKVIIKEEIKNIYKEKEEKKDIKEQIIIDNKKDIIQQNENQKENKINENIKPKKELIKKKEKEIKPIQFIVYYTFSNANKVIILHCHILDRAFKYKKMIIKEIGDNVDPHILKKDKLYINRNELLLIIKSSGPIKLYFKGKKVQMKSILINMNKLYRIKSVNEYQSPFHDVVVSINPIKDNMKLSNDLVERCQESIYTGKDILNGIDVKVEYNESFGDNMKLALSPCLLNELSSEEENTLKNQQKKEVKKEKKSYEMQKFELIEKEMNKYRKYTKEVIKNMKRSEKEDIAITLDDYKSTMDIICNYVQEKELWDLIEKVSSITNEIEQLLNLIDNN